MARMVFCQKFRCELAGLDEPPIPGELGKRIFENISKEAWQEWLRRQIMVINEYRLNLADPKAHELLDEAMEKFLFEGGDARPPGYVPPGEED